MLLPIYLGLCSSEELDTAHLASSILMAQNSATAVLVSLVHTISMVTAGGVIALLVFDWLGLKFLSKSWFNLDFVWDRRHRAPDCLNFRADFLFAMSAIGTKQTFEP